MQLMKPGSLVEAIVIYITPFVFNCDINILLNDYGENFIIEEKKYISDKKSIYQIILLFHKSHYNAYYKKNSLINILNFLIF